MTKESTKKPLAESKKQTYGDALEVMQQLTTFGRRATQVGMYIGINISEYKPIARKAEDVLEAFKDQYCEKDAEGKPKYKQDQTLDISEANIALIDRLYGQFLKEEVPAELKPKHRKFKASHIKIRHSNPKTGASEEVSPDLGGIELSALIEWGILEVDLPTE
jgi:hypothetical protein